MGPTYKKTIPSWGGGAATVVGGGVRLFGSDEERSRRGKCFFIICGPHMTYLTWQKFNPRGGHMGRLKVKRD